MDFIYEYGMFLLKAITILSVIFILLAGVFKGRMQINSNKGQLEFRSINDKTKEIVEQLTDILDDEEARKEFKKKIKQQKKEYKKKRPQRLFVLSFIGDIKASATQSFREEVTALLQMATPEDEVLVVLESQGGVVHGYGLAASQLDRIIKNKIHLTIAVDKVAASGGYMMAVVSNKIIAAPFAIIGSIGVVGQLPNFNKVLKRMDIDFEQHTAGDYKRNLTLLGENTDQGRDKFKQDLAETHELFKQHIMEFRPQLDVDNVANGDIWYGRQCLENHLVDEVMTSDEFIQQKLQEEYLAIEIEYKIKKTLADKFGASVNQLLESAISSLGIVTNK